MPPPIISVLPITNSQINQLLTKTLPFFIGFGKYIFYSLQFFNGIIRKSRFSKGFRCVGTGHAPSFEGANWEWDVKKLFIKVAMAGMRPTKTDLSRVNFRTYGHGVGTAWMKMASLGWVYR